MTDMLITREHAIACATNVGRQLGYAIGVHGSQMRDLDLIAAPWVDEAPLGTPGPATPLELAESIAHALPGNVAGKGETKPHGRLGFVIYPRIRWGVDAWYIDLSVMPRRRKRAAA